MPRFPQYENLFSTILAEGQGCACTGGSEAVHGHRWCRRLGYHPDNSPAFLYQDLATLHQSERENCWVLKDVEGLAEAYLTTFGIENPPVPSDLITRFDRNRRTEVRLLSFKAYHGTTWLSGDEWVVQLNCNDSHHEKRRTIFHEAFHIACRSVNPSFRKFNLQNRPFRELLADHFSACILMPRQWVKTRSLQGRDIGKLSELFDVSTSDLELRIKQLGIML